MFSWSICEKTATLLGVSRVAVSKIMSAFTNHEETTPVKRNSEQKSTLMERDCCTSRIVSKTHTTTAAQVTAELNIHLEDHFHKNCPM
jgi:predicted transcriptional regulator